MVQASLDNLVDVNFLEDIESSDLEHISKETEYVNKIAFSERISSKKYDELRSDKERAKYIINLIKNEEYFSVYNIYIKELCLGKKIFSKERMIKWTDNFVEKLFNDEVPSLIPIYITQMYMNAGVKRQEILDRLRPKLAEKNITPEEKKMWLEWHPDYRGALN